MLKWRARAWQPSWAGLRRIGRNEPAGAARMIAHVNIWTMNENGATSNNQSAVEVGERLRQQPGFVSYTLVRTGEREFIAITVFESEPQMRAAHEAVGDFVRDRVRPLAEGDPERRQGEVLYHVAGHPPKNE
jgi:hypothetical protein